LNFLEVFNWQKAIDFKLRAKLLKSLVLSFVKYWSLMLVKSEHHEYWYCTENLNEKNVLCICLLFFLTVTKIYDYILNIWTNSLWKCQMSARQNQDLREKCRLDFAEGHEKPLQSRKLRSSRRDLWNNIFWVQLERQGIFMVDLILACRTKKNKFDKWVFWQSSRHDVRAFYPDLFLCNCCQ
jgi:hypothetical protein